MGNLTSDRETEFVDALRRDEVAVAAGAKICNGAAVALDGGGNAINAGPGPRHFRGIADETVDNSGGGAGAVTIELITPEAAYFDGAGFAQADVGQPVYFSDDHTVTLTAGTNTFAGRVRGVDEDGVLVDLRGGYAELEVPATGAATTAG